ncbi:hypothetical protein CPB86DRAFT_796669 [Serendipita vermifera]|nr:hypothetical protein CPB86DRAFT_796669 [Serendipita vermifera]
MLHKFLTTDKAIHENFTGRQILEDEWMTGLTLLGLHHYQLPFWDWRSFEYQLTAIYAHIACHQLASPLPKRMPFQTPPFLPTNETFESRLTGYGATPLTHWELWENKLVVTIPGVLLTIEQSVRVAHVYYLPKRGVPLLWYTSKVSFWVFIFGLEIIMIDNSQYWME